MTENAIWAVLLGGLFGLMLLCFFVQGITWVAYTTVRALRERDERRNRR